MSPTNPIIERPAMKRTRRSSGRVKTGCITCKIRHIRCDETKPHCSRCTGTGRKCDGYANDESTSSKPFNVNHVSIFQSTIPSLSTPTEGIQYLEFYHHCARKTLSGNYDNGFWSRVAPQLAQSELSVRHALIALGYLNKMESGSLKHARSGFMADHQQKTLIFHYNKSVRCLFERMGEASYVPEIGLVTCLLFICIEFLRGNYHAAFTHLKKGLALVSEWRKLRMGGGPAISSAKQMSLALKDTHSTSTIVVDSLIPLFIRTMSSALLYGVDVNQVFDIPIPRPRTYERPFTTVLEAHNSIHEMLNSTLLFLTTMAQKLLFRIQIPAEDFRTQAQLLQCHHSWFEALQQLERKSCLVQDEKTMVNTLKTAYYSTYIALHCCMETVQTPYDAHLASFQALNRHARIALGVIAAANLSPSHSSTHPTSLSFINTSSPPSTQPSANFTFELRLIPSLYFAATRCRCPLTRRESLSLLSSSPPREALWDADQHHTVAKRVIDIEESDVDPMTGWPVERARLWSAVIDGNMDRDGGFWVSFAMAAWVRERSDESSSRRRRPDAQWEEWFVL